MSEDWAAVATAINDRVQVLGWRQRELAERSQVSQAIVRELQHHTVERRRSARTLEALSLTLGWHPQHLNAILRGQRPPHPDEPTGEPNDRLWSKLDSLELRLAEILERLDEVQNELSTVAAAVRPKR